MRFRAIVDLNGKTATGIEVPADVIAALGGSARPAATRIGNAVEELRAGKRSR